jgi:capsid assembly protease
MTDRYSRIVQRVHEPWAIDPEVYGQIVALVHLRQAGITLTRPDIEARIGGNGADRPETNVVGGVGVLQIFGVVAQHMDLFGQISGGTSTTSLAGELRALRSDRAVKAILLAIHSPGGEVYGIDELATEMRESRRPDQPLIAIAHSKAMSAAYWLGAQADRFLATPGGDVGSIGIVTAHTDVSGAATKAGIATELISAGPYKTEGHPFGPLTDEGRANLQARVDHSYTKFVQAVAAGRGVTEAAVRTGFGLGRAVHAEDALRLGMIDAIATFDATLAALQKDSRAALRPPVSVTATAIPQEPQAATGTRRMPDAMWRALMETEC